MSAPSIALRVRMPLGASFVLDVDVASSARSLGIFGPSGAGKTSLVETIAGWRAPESGRVEIGGRVLTDVAAGIAVPVERRGAGYVPQDALLFPHWTVGRNIRERAAAEPGGLVDRTVRVLEIGHLLDRPCGNLSGGERQRVALARAIASRPSFLLLDEPLGALDLPLRRRILPYLIRARDEFGLPTVFVSHDATEVQALCDEVVVLDLGRVRAQGAPAQVLRHARAGERAYENVLTGLVARLADGTAFVALDGGGEACVPSAGLAPGARVVFALGSDEILVALDAPTRISARNVVAALVERVDPAPDGAARVETRLAGGAGAQISAHLTRASVDELALRPGSAVHLVFKSNACRVLSTPAAGAS